MLKQLRKLQKDSQGFTLVELMIVVAIIGILAAIAIPNFRNYQLKSKRGELPMNLKAIKVAEVAYQAERDTFVALTASPRAATAAALDGVKTVWADNGGFGTIGWLPTGPVYASYDGATVAANGTIVDNITINASSDIDDDATLAVYTSVCDVGTPANETEPTLPVASANFY
jgi:type IV pilus assembly protein PilA